MSSIANCGLCGRSVLCAGGTVTVLCACLGPGAVGLSFGSCLGPRVRGVLGSWDCVSWGLSVRCLCEGECHVPVARVWFLTGDFALPDAKMDFGH